MPSLDEVKAHLRVTTEIDDLIIGAKLAAATEWVLGYTGILADAITIPAAVQEAICLMTASLYDGASTQEIPQSVIDLLSDHRKFVF